MVTDEQVKLMRRKRMDEKVNERAAAAAAAMSEPTARKWREGPLPSETKKPRWWRTREDAFEAVWDAEFVPLLEADTKPELKAKTVLAELVGEHPDEFESGHLHERREHFDRYSMPIQLHHSWHLNGTLL